MGRSSLAAFIIHLEKDSKFKMCHVFLPKNLTWIILICSLYDTIFDVPITILNKINKKYKRKEKKSL